MSELEPGQVVYVKAPTDVGTQGVVIRKDKNPDSYWVKVGQSEIRRNRKHLFLLNSDSSSDNTSDESIDELYFPKRMYLENLSNVVPAEPVVPVAPPAPAVVQEAPVPGGPVVPPALAVDPGEPAEPPAPAGAQPVITRSGRVSKPPRKRDYMYY